MYVYANAYMYIHAYVYCCVCVVVCVWRCGSVWAFLMPVLSAPKAHFMQSKKPTILEISAQMNPQIEPDINF